MKKMMKYITAAFVAIVAVSCVEEMETGVPQGAKKMVDVTFGVNIADEDITKTSLGVENDAPAVLWSEGDKVAVWDGTLINEFTLVSGAGTSSAMFTGQVTEGAEKFFVIYPYECVDSYTFTSDEHRFTLYTSEEQKAPLNGFAEKANLSAGYTTDLEAGVTMRNIAGYMKIQIKGQGISSATVFDNDNSIISGSVMYRHPATSESGYSRGSGSKYAANHVVLLPQDGKTELDEGVYYLVYRAENPFPKGMTVKFTNVNGEAAYYTSTSASTANIVNTTLDLGVADASALKWKKMETLTIDLSSWPFEEEEPTETGITGTYTLKESGKAVVVNTPTGLRDKNGLMCHTEGDYIEFPVIPGKILKEVHVTTTKAQNLYGSMYDVNDNAMSGSAPWRMYTGRAFKFILPHSQLNTAYRYKVTQTTAVNSNGAVPQVHTINLVYVGDDVAEISGVTAAATNSFTGFTVTGEVLGTGLDAAAWGIEYGTSADALTEVATGNGGMINHFVEAVAGTYHVRVWASADGGNNKTYSDVVTVEVKAFSGKITFDFARAENITILGTSSGNAEITALNKNRTFVGEDYYAYTTSEGVYPFTVYSYWIKEEGKRTNIYVKDGNEETLIYCVSNEGRFRCTPCNAAWPVWLSIPKVAGYRLTFVTYYANNNSGRNAGVDSCATLEKSVIASSVCAHTEDFKYTIDLKNMDISADTQYYFRFLTNGYYSKIIFEYEQVN